MSRSYYSGFTSEFLEQSEESILGRLASNHTFALEDLQRNAWVQQIRILKHAFRLLRPGYVLIEYTIPRMGKRADAVFLANGIVFVLEFKVGANSYASHAIDQALDYALDLKNFHKQSHDKLIVPVLIATKAPALETAELREFEDQVAQPLLANENNVGIVMGNVLNKYNRGEIDPRAWELSMYEPTPTIVEAAQALYQGHDVKEISRSDASAINLGETTAVISRIIKESKNRNQKSICFVTGVPGSGKTLAGLNIANRRLMTSAEEHAVFLSGNGPLVKVLQEALARSEVQRGVTIGAPISKRAALSRTRAFIQNIHHFRDDAISVTDPPTEKVVVFDEAQRAWTEQQTSAFMRRKKGIDDFSMSEPEFLISVMDRHTDWATIVCLIGGGQEINTGEAGLLEWFDALKTRFPKWRVYVSSRLSDYEYTRGQDLSDILNAGQLAVQDKLHLATSVRSYRSEKVSAFVKALLDSERNRARELLREVIKNYPIVLTRDFDRAKSWLTFKARGTERFGIIASSRAHRLRPYGINVKNQIDPAVWFLNPKDDIRSSYFMEETATEFDIQGLELDWVCVAWDADLRYRAPGWEYKDFRGTSWHNINDPIRQLYLKNAYRVLLTRARQGLVIFVPEGKLADNTRRPDFYDDTYDYLVSLGFPRI